MRRKPSALVSAKAGKTNAILFKLTVHERVKCVPPIKRVKSSLLKSNLRRPRGESFSRRFRFPSRVRQMIRRRLLIMVLLPLSLEYLLP